MAELVGAVLIIPVMFGMAILLVWLMAMATQAPFIWLERWGERGHRYAEPPPQPPTIIMLAQPQAQQQPAPVHNHYYLVSDGQAQPVQAPPQYLPPPQPPITVIGGADELRRLRQELPAPSRKQLPR